MPIPIYEALYHIIKDNAKVFVRFLLLFCLIFL